MLRCAEVSQPIDVMGQSRHFRTAKNNEPFRHRTTVKSVTNSARRYRHKGSNADVRIMPSDLKPAFDQSMVATRQFGIKPMMLFHGGTRAVVARVSGYGAQLAKCCQLL